MMHLETANGESEPQHRELIVCNYPASPYKDVRTPFAVIQHTDAYGLTWFYPTNRHGRISTSGHRTAESAAHAVDLMVTNQHPQLRKMTPFQLGYRDGYKDGQAFGMGLTWDDDLDANEEYDRGVNAGQAAAALEGR